MAHALVGVLGAAVGSFLNVCIYRLPRERSPIWPASECPRCEAPIAWFDNVPVLSYLWLRGRCRRCHAPISLVYPVVELANAGLWVYLYATLGWQPLLPARMAFASAMITLFAIDLAHRILPNVITVPGIAAGFLLSVAGVGASWLDALIGILAGGGGLLLVAEVYYRVRGEEGLGMGDVKMLAMIGAFLGWKLMLLTLLLSSLLGSVTGLLIIVAGRGSLKYALPFGTFLAVGAIAAMAFGDPFLRWYLTLYRH